MVDIKKPTLPIKPIEEYFTIEIEAMIPATLKYKILAETPEKALAKLNLSTPLLEAPKYKYGSMRKIATRIFKYGTSLLKYSKNF